MVNKKRKNPNKVPRRKRIPAKQGAKTTTKSGDKVEVVLPTKTKIVYRSRRGDTKRIKELEQQLQQRRIQPVRRANVLPQDLSAFGGYTGLTEGYGVKPNKDQKINERLDRLDKKLDNLAQRQQNPSVDLKPELIREVKTTRTTPTQTIPERPLEETRNRSYLRPQREDKAATKIQGLFRRKQAQDIRHALEEQQLQDIQ